jgi:hypothetical protein
VTEGSGGCCGGGGSGKKRGRGRLLGCRRASRRAPLAVESEGGGFAEWPWTESGWMRSHYVGFRSKGRPWFFSVGRGNSHQILKVLKRLVYFLGIFRYFWKKGLFLNFLTR